MATNRYAPIGWVDDNQDFRIPLARNMSKKENLKKAKELYAKAESMRPAIREAWNDPKSGDLASKLNAERIEFIMAANIHWEYAKTS